MMKKVIAIVAGGDSSEWEVSLRSAAGLNSFIDGDKYTKYIVTIVGKKWQVELPDGGHLPIDKNDFSFVLDNQKVTFDFAYITIHGTPGENGILQGYFRLIGLPFSCCDVLQAALTFDKYACNNYLKSFGFKVAESIVLRPCETIDNTTVANKIGFPCFIKPSVGGSSFGVTKVKTIDQIQPAIAKAFAEGDEVMIEAFLSGTEVTCGMYKTKTKSVIFPITEVVTTNEFFDYDAKYNGQVDEITPARLSDELTQAIKDTTERIYTILHAKGIIRVDYIISPDGTINLLEVNTTPGMTATSFIPQQIRAAGLDIKDVMNDIIENELN
jgi:D-alanine-D-alanine ligase